MIHLLAPTDFSTASRAGIRLAIQWSRQQPTKILFVHVLHIPRLTKWSDLQYKAFAAAERSRCEKELDRFVGDIYKKLDLAADNYVNLVLEGIRFGLIEQMCRAAGIPVVFDAAQALRIARRVGVPVVFAVRRRTYLPAGTMPCTCAVLV